MLHYSEYLAILGKIDLDGGFDIQFAISGAGGSLKFGPVVN